MIDAQKNRSEDSLAPVELDRLTIEEEVAVMNRGKGWQIFSVALAAFALIAGGASVMKTLDRKEAELQHGQAVAELRMTHVEAYLRCAAPKAAAGAFDGSDRIHETLEGVVERGKKSAGVALTRCAQELKALEPALSQGEVGDELKPALRGLRTTASDLTRAAAALAGYLQDPAASYDYVHATALIDHVARAAAAYRERDAAFRTKLSGL